MQVILAHTLTFGAICWDGSVRGSEGLSVPRVAPIDRGGSDRRTRPALLDDERCAPMSTAAGVVAPAGANAVLAWSGEDLQGDVDFDAGA
jgi:hypothetical protein